MPSEDPADVNHLIAVPFVIGLSYTAIIIAFAPASVALNAARDLGGRIACAGVYGTKCFTFNSR